MRTVPQIFNGEIRRENLIGGYDEMMSKFKSGELFKK
jgi:glutaredoxin